MAERFYLERMVLGDDDELWPEIMASTPTFEEAVDWASDNLVRKGWADAYNILIGDSDGPDERVARIERSDVAEIAKAHRMYAELVLTIEVAGRVPREFIEKGAAEEIFTAIGGPHGDSEYTVLVQLAPQAAAKDEAGRRYQLLEMADVRPAQRAEDEGGDGFAVKRFDLLEYNPRRRGVFTKKGERLYKQVLATTRLSAESKRRAAPAEAKRAVVRAAQRGVPGLVRKNPSPAYVVTDDRGHVVFSYTVDVDRGLRDDIEQALDLFTFWINESAPRSIRRRDEEPEVVDENGGLTLTFQDPPATYYLHEPRTNPMRYGGHEPAEIFAEDADAAIDKYKEFHRYDPKKVEEIRGLAIPRRVRRLGPAAYVLYRSGKVDPATLEKPRKPVDYIHEHDAGVTIYTTDGSPDTDVPKSIYEATALVRLGYCLGFKLKDGTEAQGTAPLPDLCCTPDGKCLLVVQSKRKVLAMFWGGALGVFARGIDG